MTRRSPGGLLRHSPGSEGGVRGRRKRLRNSDDGYRQRLRTELATLARLRDSDTTKLERHL
jgi:hypothetical protein